MTKENTRRRYLVKNFGVSAKFFLVLAVAASIAAAGCSAKKNFRESEVLAKINNYELGADDFREEAALTMSDGRLGADKAKEDILDKLITKKILLQEAQRHNFDKDAKFMKEIERYWEQALLKLLIKKKIAEFSKAIPADIQGDARQKMLRSELDKWVTSVRGSAKVKIYKENLEKVQIK